MSPKNRNDPIPLTQWIRGSIRVHFRGGHVAQVETSLASAHSLRLQADGTRGGDRIDGVQSHEGWISAKSDEVVLTEWIPAADYGWVDTPPEHREQLRRLGMNYGVLHALGELWASRGGSPAYSIAAVSVLYGIAISERTTREEWDKLARATAGQDGAGLVASIWEDLAEGSTPSARVDDAAEPEASPTAEDANSGLDEGSKVSEPGDQAPTSQPPPANEP